MTRRVRSIVLFVGLIGTAAFLLWGLNSTPSFGHYRGPYGIVLLHRAVPERHATNVVASVVFDYRGFDTVAEEFIFFASVIGVTLLLRRQREERERSVSAEDRALGRTSDAVRVFVLALVGPTVLLGMYLVAHGQLTPGGGFQGGMVLGGGLLFVYLAGRLLVFRRVSPMGFLDFNEGVGAAGFVMIGLLGLVVTGAFLENVLPLGQVGSIFSAGTIPLINLSVGLEIAAGLVLVVHEFLEQTLFTRRR
jgi:multicomponent Na+:H+ antiporter subunit B